MRVALLYRPYRSGKDSRLHRSNKRIAIESLEFVPADAQHLHSHPYAVSHRVDLGAVVMRPLHRHFCCAELELIGQEQQLRIEAPPLYPLPAEYGVSRLARERLKAAWRVAIL